MDVPLRETVDAIREVTGASLLAVDIWETTSALSLSSFGTTPATAPMLHRVTDDLRQAAAFSDSKLDDYYVLAVRGGVVAVVSRPHLSAAILLAPTTDPVRVITHVVPALRNALNAVELPIHETQED